MEAIAGECASSAVARADPDEQREVIDGQRAGVHRPKRRSTGAQRLGHGAVETKK
jgi:hypothetical protein